MPFLVAGLGLLPVAVLYDGVVVHQAAFPANHGGHRHVLAAAPVDDLSAVHLAYGAENGFHGLTSSNLIRVRCRGDFYCNQEGQFNKMIYCNWNFRPNQG